MLLITGGLGFIGAHTVRAALDADGACIATTRTTRELPAVLADPSRTPRSHAARPDADEPHLRPMVEGLDVRNADAIVELGRRHPITGIIHLAAARIDVPPLEQVDQNLQGLLAVVKAASVLGAQRVTLASSIGVYAGVTGASMPLSEDTPLPPVGLHGIQASKKMLEVAGDLASRSGDVEVVAVRIPAVWGPGGHPSSRFFELPQLVHAAVTGEPLPDVTADAGIETVYVRDAGRALVAVQASDRLEHRLYNLGSGVSTNAQIVEAIRDAVPDVVAGVTEPVDPASPFALDTRRIRAETDWAPVYDLTTGIADYVGWLRAGHER